MGYIVIRIDGDPFFLDVLNLGIEKTSGADA